MEVVADIIGIVIVGEGLPVHGVVDSENRNCQEYSEKSVFECRRDPLSRNMGLLLRHGF